MPSSPSSACSVAVAGRHRSGGLAGLLLLSGLSLLGTLPAVALAQSAPAERPDPADPHGGHITEAAQRFSIPPAWIRAVMRIESAGNVRAISPKGAMGLMQIMPETWAELRVRHRLGSDAFDPRDNILAGTAYLRELLDRYGSPGFLATYNAGPGRYEEHLAGRPLPAETRAYVAKLRPIFGGGEPAASATIVAAADPRAWTRAPLFIAQSGRTPAADSVQRGGSRDDAPTAAARDIPAIAPQSAGLFVARSYAGAPR
jgi:soluble lytic murein transglycosylase-like protein